jgi:hypothetical protein
VLASGGINASLIGGACGKLPGLTGCEHRGTMADGDDAEREQVVETARAIFTAVSENDEALFNAVIAPDFYLFEGGVRFADQSRARCRKKLQMERDRT